MVALSMTIIEQVESSRRIACYRFIQIKKISTKVKSWTREITGDSVQSLLMSHMICTPSFPLLWWFLVVVSSENHVIPPHNFFHRDLWSNAAGYTEVLESVVKPWIDLECNELCACSQSCSVPRLDGSQSVQPHHTKKWLPNSLDLNPFDYYIWSIVEWENNQCSHNATVSLKPTITQVMSSKNTDNVMHAYQWFWSHIEAIIVAEGSYIK